jgi:MFS family permease
MQAQSARLYYGWIIVGIGFFNMMLVMGTFFSSGVLFAAIIGEFGWSRTAASLPFSIALICYAATAWLAGQLFDRYGPRRLFPLGVLMLGIGLLLSARASASWHLVLSWGLLVSQGFNVAGFVPHVTQVALWFLRRRGVASGLMISGASVGALLVVPGVQYLVDHLGWRSAYTLLGLAVMVCLVPLNLLWQRHRPADLGLHPDGDADALPVPAHLPTPAAAASTAPPWTLWRAVGTSRFWLLCVMAACIGWLSNITGVHQIAHLIDNGFPGILAASMVGFAGLLRAFSSTLWGGLSDRFGREGVYTFGSAFVVASLFLLAFLHPASAVWMLYGYALTYGIGYGVHGAVEASATADLFYGPHLGAILGALELGWGLGGFVGAWLGGFWYDQWGSYHGAYLLTTGIAALGCLALWGAAPRHAHRLASEPQSATIRPASPSSP